MSDKVQHLVLIDGMSFLFRAFHAVRGNLSRADGTPTNALFGFSQMLIKVVDDLKPTHCAMVLDSKGKTFRHELYDKYKANRPAPDPALIAQMEFLEPLVSAFGLPILRQSGMEADDLIATAVTHAHQALPGARVTIVTSDKDLMQLVTDARAPVTVRLYDTFKDKFLGIAEVNEKFGVRPDQVIDVQSLIGDTSDNVPGVPGIGPKTAANLLNEFDSLEGLYNNLDKVKNERIRNLLADNKDKAILSKQLVSLKTDCPLPDDHNLEFHPALHQAADYLRDTLEFRTLAKRLDNRDGSPKAAPLHAPDASSEAAFAGKSGGKEGKPSARTFRALFDDGSKSSAPVNPALVNTPFGGYTCVQTADVWKTWLQNIKETGWVAFDTETTSLNPLQATLVGISLSTGPGKACYVPLMHGKLNAETTTEDLFSTPTTPEAPEQLPTDKILKDLMALVKDGVVLVAHNLKYDWEILARSLGITPTETGSPLQTLLTAYEDTLLMSACLDGGRWNHGLDDLTARHLNHSMIPYEEVCGKGKTQCTFDAVPLDKATAYAAEDADATARLFLHFSSRMLTEGTPHQGEAYGPYTVYNDIEKKLLPTIIALETRGVTLDTTLLAGLSGSMATRLAELESKVHELAGESFNLGSPKQLGEVLFDKLKLGTEAMKKKKSTGIEVLEALAEDDKNPQAQSIGTAMMEYRQFSKLRSTYTEVLPRQVNSQTGRVHTTYHQIGAATGRFSSADPNLQNIPIRTEEGRKIRQAFIPQKGWVMLSADYSQIELRLLAHFSGSAPLRQAFEDGLDIHAYTAALVANKPIEEVSKTERRAAKFVNFGLVYGMGARSLAKQIGCSLTEAQTWLDAYFNRYTGVKEYLEETRQFARENGYVETLYGRRIWLPDITSSHGGFRSNAERAAINAPLQGSNADIIKKAMPAVEAMLAEHKLKAQTLLQVHDELVLEAPEAEVEKLKTLLPDTMTGVVKLAVPLVAEVGTGPNWDSAH